MDVHVALQITEGLRRRDVDVVTAQEDGSSVLTDPELLSRAAELDRVLVTHDVDFTAEVVRRQLNQQNFAGVIYAHLLNITIGQCVDELELVAQVYEQDEMANRLLYLPLR
jgi:predicted nuclease of predicted toxin-antitoxin system